MFVFVVDLVLYHQSSSYLNTQFLIFYCFFWHRIVIQNFRSTLNEAIAIRSTIHIYYVQHIVSIVGLHQQHTVINLNDLVFNFAKNAKMFLLLRQLFIECVVQCSVHLQPIVQCVCAPIVQCIYSIVRQLFSAFTVQSCLVNNFAKQFSRSRISQTIIYLLQFKSIKGNSFLQLP